MSSLFNLNNPVNNEEYSKMAYSVINEYALVKHVEGDILVDIGSNLGCFMDVFGNKFKTCYGFEASYENFIFSIKKKEENQFIFNLAITNENKLVKIFSSKEKTTICCGNNTLINGNEYWDENQFHNIVGIDLKTMLGLIFPNEKGKIDLLKIDVEGSEYDILNNNISNIERHVEWLVIEFHCFVYESCKKLESLLLNSSFKEYSRTNVGSELENWTILFKNENF